MKLLPDIIAYGLRILFIGYNPGLKSAETGHHYAGSSNGFWKLLHESGLTPVRIKPEEDARLLEIGMGSVNVADRPTRSAAELTSAELLEGTAVLKRKLHEYSPRIACYMGIGVYKAVSSLKIVNTGKQTACFAPGIIDYVCTSPSGLNRVPYRQQLECFKALKKLADTSDISRP